MAATTDDVQSLLIFARVVEAKSFTAGAARLGISKSVASARIAALEERLGTRLLLRTTRRLTLTPDGLALYEHAAQMASAADAAAATGAGASPEPRGVLRVNAPVVFAQLYLVEPIAAFLEQHPRVRVELLLADRLVDLVEEGIDVALRISARLRDSQLIGRKLCEDHTLVCASPAYLARRGTPREPAELIHHECLRYSLLESADEWRFRDPARPRGESRSFSVPVEARFHAQSGSVLREAALAGLGLAVLPSFMVARDLAAGTLVQVLAPYSFVRIAIQALYAPARVLPGNVRAFVDLLSQRFRKPPWAA
ncbi:MAG TPA: LysR family transcriptional regulator [Polyangiaceae bacterium]|nr:LysR family transcriptional regulator [Polyangiaceae bacterium]